MVNVYILVSDQRTDLTIDGNLELFGQLLAAVQQVVPPERNAGESEETEPKLARTHRERSANADASSAGHAPAGEKRS